MPRIGRYDVVYRLATGGMAEVFLAFKDDEGKRTPVALKRILPQVASDPELVKMLLDEARISSHLTHPGIAKVIDVGREGSMVFLAMEYVDGCNVRTLLQAAAEKKEKLPARVSLYLVGRAAEALHYAHTKTGANGKPLEIVHRDLSPANLMIARDGEVKVIDFGIARAADRLTRTQAGVVKGKFRYMAPEQATGGATDHRADIYSLGVVLYEALAGQPILQGKGDMEVMVEVVGGRVPRLATLGAKVAPPIESLVMKAMHKDPAQRHPTAAALAEELLGIVRSMGGIDAARAQAKELVLKQLAAESEKLAKTLPG